VVFEVGLRLWIGGLATKKAGAGDCACGLWSMTFELTIGGTPILQFVLDGSRSQI
jgi:hypothetical protein